MLCHASAARIATSLAFVDAVGRLKREKCAVSAPRVLVNAERDSFVGERRLMMKLWRARISRYATPAIWRLTGFLRALGFLALVRIEVRLADADRGGRNFDEFVVFNPRHRLLER